MEREMKKNPGRDLDAELQRLSQKRETSTKGEWLGSCSLYVWNKMHLDFKLPGRILIYVCMTALAVNKGWTIEYFDKLVCELCHIKSQSYFLPNEAQDLQLE